VPRDPDHDFLDFFEAAVTRNLGLLWGFETIAEDMTERGIVPPTEGEQATLVTDGGRPECPDCGHELDTEDNNDALAADEHNEYFCPRCGRLFEDVPLTDGGEDTALPVDDVASQMLDSWTHRGGGWDTWTAPSEDYRIHVEMVDLEVPPDEVRYAYEIRLDDCRGGRPFETVVRETVRNSALALIIADELARSAACFVDEWNEGLAPRPEEVGYGGE